MHGRLENQQPELHSRATYLLTSRLKVALGKVKHPRQTSPHWTLSEGGLECSEIHLLLLGIYDTDLGWTTATTMPARPTDVVRKTSVVADVEPFPLPPCTHRTSAVTNSRTRWHDVGWGAGCRVNKRLQVLESAVHSKRTHLLSFVFCLSSVNVCFRLPSVSHFRFRFRFFLFFVFCDLCWQMYVLAGVCKSLCVNVFVCVDAYVPRLQTPHLINFCPH